MQLCRTRVSFWTRLSAGSAFDAAVERIGDRPAQVFRYITSPYQPAIHHRCVSTSQPVNVLLVHDTAKLPPAAALESAV